MLDLRSSLFKQYKLLRPKARLHGATCLRMFHLWAGRFRHENIPRGIDRQVMRPAELTWPNTRAAEFIHDFQIASPQHRDEMRSAVGAIEKIGRASCRER